MKMQDVIDMMKDVRNELKGCDLRSNPNYQTRLMLKNKLIELGLVYSLATEVALKAHVDVNDQAFNDKQFPEAVAIFAETIMEVKKITTKIKETTDDFIGVPDHEIFLHVANTLSFKIEL
jgi:hypothetical protein